MMILNSSCLENFPIFVLTCTTDTNSKRLEYANLGSFKDIIHSGAHCIDGRGFWMYRIGEQANCALLRNMIQ